MDRHGGDPEVQQLSDKKQAFKTTHFGRVLFKATLRILLVECDSISPGPPPFEGPN